MPSGNEFLADKPKTSLLLCSNFGEGKTSVAITFPKLFYFGFRQGGLEVLRKPVNAKYRENLIHYEEFVPKSDEELKTMFQPDGRKGSIYKALDLAKEMAAKGEVETLVLDDFTDGVNNMHKYVWTFQVQKSANGELNTQGMYGQLLINVSNIFDRDILTFRRFGNVLTMCHLMREAEQTLEGNKTRAGAVDKMSDLLPDIVGSFRREVQRKFENVLYMESKVQADKSLKYIAYTSKQPAMGTIVLAKNVLGLPPIVENVTYESLMKSVNQAAPVAK